MQLQTPEYLEVMRKHRSKLKKSVMQQGYNVGRENCRYDAYIISYSSTSAFHLLTPSLCVCCLFCPCCLLLRPVLSCPDCSSHVPVPVPAPVPSPFLPPPS